MTDKDYLLENVQHRSVDGGRRCSIAQSKSAALRSIQTYFCTPSPRFSLLSRSAISRSTHRSRCIVFCHGRSPLRPINFWLAIYFDLLSV